MDKTLQEVQQWKEDSFKYTHMRDRYTEYARKLTEALAIVESVINELDPMILSNPRNAFAPIVSHAYEMLRKGRELTRENIESTFDIPPPKASYVIQQLKNLSDVLSRKEGRTVVLYVQVPKE